MLLRFLIGDRRAILALAGDRRLPWMGAVLVAAAAVARCYDREDLAREPWHLLIPFAVSLGTAAVMLWTILLIGWNRWDGGRPGAAHAVAFVGLFWCTAPLAWAYGVPWEHLVADQATGVAANLWTLEAVSAWRVLLMIRVVVVLFGMPWWTAGVLVLAIADLVLLAMLRTVPTPIFAIMGGVMEDAAVRRLAASAFIWQVIAILGLIPLGCALLAIAGTRRPLWTAASLPSTRPTWRGPLLAAVAVMMAGVALLPVFQPAQRNRSAIDAANRAGHQAEVVRLAAVLGRASLPPDWRLPAPATIAGWTARLHAVTPPETPTWLVAQTLRQSSRRPDDALIEPLATVLANHPTLIPEVPLLTRMVLERLPAASPVRERLVRQVTGD